MGPTFYHGKEKPSPLTRDYKWNGWSNILQLKKRSRVHWERITNSLGKSRFLFRNIEKLSKTLVFLIISTNLYFMKIFKKYDLQSNGIIFQK